MSTTALLPTSFDGGKEHHQSISPSEGQTELPAPPAPLPASSPEKCSSREVIDSQVEQSASSLVGNGHVTLPSDIEGDSIPGITPDDSLTVEVPGTVARKASTDDTSAGDDVVAPIDQVYTFVHLLTFVKLLET